MQEQDERGRKSPTGPSPRSSAAQAPSAFDLEHRERSGCPGRLKSSLLDTHRVPLDVGELLRFEGAFVHAEDQGGPSESDLLVHVLQEVENPREVVVDHEVLDPRSEEHTSELQSHSDLVCRLLLEKKKKRILTEKSE